MYGLQPIKIAILAMGGEGGGVLADWIVNLGEHNGYIAQTTSVPGVAQRTGATIYYVELFPKEQAERDGGTPVLALMPLPGDVDVVLASELMEAGRAVQRGLVTADRTTLITSTHRVYAISEKIAMGDGRVDSDNLMAHATKSAKKCVHFDMAKIAEKHGSVISSVLFGALAGANVLPFSRLQFEDTIKRGGVGVNSSLKAFESGYVSVNTAIADVQPSLSVSDQSIKSKDPKVSKLLNRIHTEFPSGVQPLIVEGIRRLIDYQDLDYAELYLNRLEKVALRQDGEGDLLQEVARHLALWMSYEDTIRVADLKTRGRRFSRVQSEASVNSEQHFAIHEFMHPRIEEICETLPVSLGLWLSKPHFVHKIIARFTQEGRMITTSSLRGFLLLWGLSRLRSHRRGTLRFKIENERIEQWLSEIHELSHKNPTLAVELVRCQRLIKGYSDTHARGSANYKLLMDVVKRVGAALEAKTLSELRDAALADEKGVKLKSLLAQHSLI